MRNEHIEALELGISPIDNRTILIIETGLDWVRSNTTIVFDKNSIDELKALPPCVRLFLVKYFDIQTMPVGVASESISGMSQSFETDKKALIWDTAEEVLGDYLKSRVRFVTAKKRWREWA